MALDLLAQAYANEDSQTLTNNANGLDNEDSSQDTVIIEEYNDDTVIQNHDTYIDALINTPERQFSASATLTLSPNALLISSHGSVHNNTPNYQHQPSQDFLFLVENFQKQLHEKKKENEVITNKLKQVTKDYDKLLSVNNELKHQMKELKDKDKAKEAKHWELTQKSQDLVEKNEVINSLNDKISQQNIMAESLCKQIEQYETIMKWLQMQIKLGSNSSNKKISVQALEQWKKSIIIDYHNQQNQQQCHPNEYEKVPLLNVKKDIKNQKIINKYENKIAMRNNISNLSNVSNTANIYCCIPWH